MENQNVEFVLRVAGAEDMKLFIAPAYVAALGNPSSRVSLNNKTYKPKMTVNFQTAAPNMGVGPIVVNVDGIQSPPVLELIAE